MRDVEPRLVDFRVSIQEQIHVDRPRAAGRNAAAVAPEGALDLEQRLEQPPRLEARLELDRAVQEPGLVDDPDRSRVAKRRDIEDRSGRELPQRLDRQLERPLPVPEVRAEADEGARHAATLAGPGVQFVPLSRLALLSLLAFVLAGPAAAQSGGTALVEVRTGSGPLVRAAGGNELAPELRLWRVPVGAVAGLRKRGIVVRAERERLFVRTSSVLDEPSVDTEWWRTAIGADAAPAPGPGKPVTIVDSGLDITHSEFASRPNTTLLNDQTTSFEDDDHGTEVASVIAAPGVGMTGVYPQAVLRSYDASPFGFITAGDAVRGIVTAATRGGPGVINLSFGGEEDDPLVHQAVLYAFRRGSLVVASSGNDGLAGNPLSYPASYPHVLTIAATDEAGGVASFSSQSNDVDLAAPGRHIRVAEPVTDDPSGYIFASGTSFSAPMVSAAAAWVWTVRPELDNTQLFDVMRFSAHDIGAPGYDRATGFGLLNIPSALALATPARDPLEPNDDIDEVSTAGIFVGGQPAVLTASRRTTTLTARVDRHEDPHDVYRAFVPARGSLTARASDGAVDLRIFRSGARDIGAKAAAISKKSGVAPDVATVRNTLKRGVYFYVEIRPDAATVHTLYTLKLTASARR
jgi:subtilisin family serine protease